MLVKAPVETFVECRIRKKNKKTNILMLMPQLKHPLNDPQERNNLMFYFIRLVVSIWKTCSLLRIVRDHSPISMFDNESFLNLPASHSGVSSNVACWKIYKIYIADVPSYINLRYRIYISIYRWFPLIYRSFPRVFPIISGQFWGISQLLQPRDWWTCRPQHRPLLVGTSKMMQRLGYHWLSFWEKCPVKTC